MFQQGPRCQFDTSLDQHSQPKQSSAGHQLTQIPVIPVQLPLPVNMDIQFEKERILHILTWQPVIPHPLLVREARGRVFNPKGQQCHSVECPPNPSLQHQDVRH